MTDRLAEPLTRAVGTRSAGPLAKLGLETVGDLLRHYPRRYGDPGRLTDLGGLALGEHVTIVAQVRSATVRRMRNRAGAILEAVVTDGPQQLSLTFFAKSPNVLRYHEQRLAPGRHGLFTGVVGLYRGTRQLTHPDYKIIGMDDDDAEDAESAVLEASRPIPIYPASGSIPSWKIQPAVRTVLDPLREEDVPDPLPDAVRERHGLGTRLERCATSTSRTTRSSGAEVATACGTKRRSSSRPRSRSGARGPPPSPRPPARRARRASPGSSPTSTRRCPSRSPRGSAT